jgi:hypothetical protein
MISLSLFGIGIVMLPRLSKAAPPGSSVELAKTTYLLSSHGGYAYIDEMPESDVEMGFAPEYDTV